MLNRAAEAIRARLFSMRDKEYAAFQSYDTIEDADGKERRVLNAKETTLAAQKQQAIREAFRDWIWRPSDHIILISL